MVENSQHLHHFAICLLICTTSVYWSAQEYNVLLDIIYFGHDNRSSPEVKLCMDEKDVKDKRRMWVSWCRAEDLELTVGDVAQV